MVRNTIFARQWAICRRFASLQSIQNGHGYIGHENIRIQSQNRVDGLIAIRHGINDFKVLAQDCTNLCHHCLMIISEHHSNLGHGNSFAGAS